MFPKICFAATLALAGPAAAQAPGIAASADCRAKIPGLEQGVAEARAKGQMLRRRQLAEALATLQANCGAPAASPAPAERGAAIELLEADIRQLRIELDRDEAQLRRLRDEDS